MNVVNLETLKYCINKIISLMINKLKVKIKKILLSGGDRFPTPFYSLTKNVRSFHQIHAYD